MQMTIIRFSDQTLTANRNVNALRLRGSQGTSAGTLVPTFIHSLNKMSAEVLIAAVTGHPVLYEPTLFQFRDRNAIVVWISSDDKREYL